MTHPPVLTPRQGEVLWLYGIGLTKRAVAYRCGIAPHTVTNHLTHATERLGASGTREAFFRAFVEPRL